MENLTLSGQSLQLSRGSWNWSQSGPNLGANCTIEGGAIDNGFRLGHSNPALSASGGGVWAYRIPLTVTETGGVDRVNDTVAFHVDFEAGLESDPRRDVRLTDSSDAEVPVFVWNVSYTGRQCTGADIIFTVPAISALASTTFDLYFGNYNAGAPSYGRQVYIAEGFRSPALSPGWTMSNADGLAYSTGGALRVQGTATTGLWQGVSLDNEQPLPADFEVQASIRLGSGSGTGYLALLTVYQDAQNSVNLGIEYDAGVPGLSPAKFILGRTVAGATSVDCTADAGSAGASHLFRGVCSSGTFTAYVDGTPLGSVAVSLQGPRIRLLASARAAGDSVDATFDQVLASTGYSSLSLSEDTLVTGWSSYRLAGYVSEASLTSPLIENRDRLPYGTVRLDWAPGDRGYYIDVLGPDNETLSGPLYIGQPVDISPDEYPAIRLRAVIGSSDPHATPRLLGWGVGTSWVPDLTIDGKNGQNLTMGEDGLRMSRSPERWNKSASPALNLGVASTFDDLGVSHPWVLQIDGEYRMYYAGYDGARWRIGLATSADGSAWTRYPDNPVLVPGGGWDASQLDWPCVVYNGHGYEMWYAGSADGGATFQIGYATSDDGIAWTRYAANPVVGTGAPGGWSSASVFAPRVRLDGSAYTMWYAGKGPTNTSIGLATSADGASWTPSPSNPVLAPSSSGWSSGGVVPGGVQRLPDGSFRLWYAGFNATLQCVGLAESPDGVAWTARPQPVLSNGTGAAFDRSGASCPSVLFEQGGMWYTAYDGARFRIGQARPALFTGGSLLSAPVDLGTAPAALRMASSFSAPAQTNLTVQARSSPDGRAWSAWTALGPSLAPVAAGRYIQWSATFRTSGNDSTPSVQAVLADFEYYHGSGAVELPPVALPPSQELTSALATTACSGGTATVVVSLDDGATWQPLEPGVPFSLSGTGLRLRTVLSGNYTTTPRLSGVAYSYTYDSFPSDCALDAGADGAADWSFSGVLSARTAVTGLAAALNGYLDAHRNDSGDARLIPLSFSSATSCAVNLSGMAVEWSPRTFPNSPPRIDSRPPERARLNEPYVYVVVGRDPDRRDRLSYTLEEAPEGMTISEMSGEITWQPYADDVGYHDVRVTVSDGKESASQQYTLVVSSSPVNNPPHLSGSPPGSARVGYEYACAFNATDPDGDKVRFSLGRSAPAGATVQESSGNLSWIPSMEQAGLNTFEVFASDGTDPVRLAFTVNVTAAAANGLPAVTSNATPVARANLLYRYNITAADPDGDQLTFRLVSGPASATLTPGGSLSWTPGLSETGIHTIVVRISDGKGSIIYNFTLRVTISNRAPIFLGPPDSLEVTAGRTWTFLAKASDADNDALSYYLALRPSGMVIDPATGALTWSPSSSLSGKYLVSVAVSDGFNTTYLNFTLAVKGNAAQTGLVDQYGLVFIVLVLVIVVGGGAAAALSGRRRGPATAGGPAPAEETAGSASGAPDGEAAAGPTLSKPRIIPLSGAAAEPAGPGPGPGPAPVLPPPEPAASGVTEPMKPVGTISKELQAAVEATLPPPLAPAPPLPPPLEPSVALPPAAEAPWAPGVAPGAEPSAQHSTKPVIAPPPAPTLTRPATAQPAMHAHVPAGPAPAPAPTERPVAELYKPIPGPYDDRPLRLDDAYSPEPPAAPSTPAEAAPATAAPKPPLPSTAQSLDSLMAEMEGSARAPAPPPAKRSEPTGLSEDMDFISSFLQSRDKARDEKVVEKSAEWGMLKDFTKDLETAHQAPRAGPEPAGKAPPAGTARREEPKKPEAPKKPDGSLSLDDILNELES
jgi:predicted GH43/DUF377 family glycosyl hydrolase